MTESEKFQLYTQCSPVKLVVGLTKEEAPKVKLKEETIRNLVESRLRSARIYDETDTLFTLLGVNITVVGSGFSVLTELYQGVTTTFSGRGLSVTWQSGNTGTHGEILIIFYLLSEKTLINL